MHEVKLIFDKTNNILKKTTKHIDNICKKLRQHYNENFVELF
jgi:hypothetical protein